MNAVESAAGGETDSDRGAAWAAVPVPSAVPSETTTAAAAAAPAGRSLRRRRGALAR